MDRGLIVLAVVLVALVLFGAWLQGTVPLGEYE